MLPTPNIYMITTGAGDGDHRLTAFDKALLTAGVANVNLVRLSSILPPCCRQMERIALPPGSLVPTAYGMITSDHPGDLISAAIGVGISSEESFGVIMEYSGHCSAAQAEETVRRMVEEGFAARQLSLLEIHSKAVEHVVQRNGSAFAAAVLWYE